MMTTIKDYERKDTPEQLKTMNLTIDGSNEVWKLPEKY